MKKLYLFNPNHDLALANGSMSYMSPESARQFANDIAYLPAWFANGGDILVPRGFHWYPPMQLPVYYVTPEKVSQKHYHKFIPWGWNEAICKQVQELGVDPEILRSKEELQAIRMISHRNIAARAMRYIQTNQPEWHLPPPCETLLTIEEVEAFAAKHKRVVYKSPWSGSGKGIFFTEAPLTDSLLGWCRRTIYKQHGVMGEVALDKVEDFAMEFLIENKRVTFAGYSLFESEASGIYRANRLLSDQQMEEELTKWCTIEYLEKIKELYIDFLTLEVMPIYQGYIGVDMLIYKENDTHYINPAVELNIRMTMGMVARLFYDKYVTPGQKGWFYIDHMPRGLQEDHYKQMENYPLEIRNGKVESGYLSLCPIETKTHYRVRVMIETEDK